MPATQTASHPDGNPPTFESVWALFQEVGKKQEETARIVKETSKQIGKLNNRFGEIVEYMVVPNLREKFREYGLRFNEAMCDRVFCDDDDNTLFEVDVFLQNSDKAMLVEVKTTLTTEDVKDHIERLEKMRAYADLHGDSELSVRCTYLGAVAGIVLIDEVKEYALSKGFYFIEYAGEQFYITPPNDKPKEW